MDGMPLGNSVQMPYVRDGGDVTMRGSWTGMSAAGEGVEDGGAFVPVAPELLAGGRR